MTDALGKALIAHAKSRKWSQEQVDRAWAFTQNGQTYPNEQKALDAFRGHLRAAGFDLNEVAATVEWATHMQDHGVDASTGALMPAENAAPQRAAPPAAAKQHPAILEAQRIVAATQEALRTEQGSRNYYQSRAAQAAFMGALQVVHGVTEQDEQARAQQHGAVASVRPASELEHLVNETVDQMKTPEGYRTYWEGVRDPGTDATYRQAFAGAEAEASAADAGAQATGGSDAGGSGAAE